MEPAEVSQDGSWSLFNGANLVEESEFMAQLLGPCQFSNEQGQHDQSYGLASMQWSSDHAADPYYCSSDNVYWSQGDESSNNGLQFSTTPGYESYYNLNRSSTFPTDIDSSAAMNYCMVGDQFARQSPRVTPNAPAKDPISMNEEDNSDNHQDSSKSVTGAVQPKKKPRMQEDNFPSESCKKKTRASTNVTKSSSKKANSKRISKSSENGDDRENAAANGGQSSCSYSSEDDSHTSQEQNGGGGCTSSSSMGTTSLNPNGKTRAGRGSATDPQSLYARKRRERINERLKILQNLVPNGTKVDISTMLEEAVQYVKFLQLQIKLLSSDDLWMYAPIAYNGMNIGLDLKISPPQ